MNLIKKQHKAYPSTTIWDDFFGKDFFDINGGSRLMSNLPAVNIKNTADEVNIELAAPGMKKEDFKIEVDNDLLSISSEKEHQSESTEGEYTRKEFGYSSFKRSFTLPQWAEGDKIEAKYTDGVLHVRVPKKEEAKEKPSRLIQVG